MMGEGCVKGVIFGGGSRKRCKRKFRFGNCCVLEERAYENCRAMYNHDNRNCKTSKYTIWLILYLRERQLGGRPHPEVRERREKERVVLCVKEGLVYRPVKVPKER